MSIKARVIDRDTAYGELLREIIRNDIPIEDKPTGVSIIRNLNQNVDLESNRQAINLILNSSLTSGSRYIMILRKDVEYVETLMTPEQKSKLTLIGAQNQEDISVFIQDLTKILESLSSEPN